MLTAKIMRQFRIRHDWSQAGYYETARAKEIGADIRAACQSARNWDPISASKRDPLGAVSRSFFLI